LEASARQRHKPDLIDINSASKEQLLTLPGIDESRAQKIIETRPFKKKNELKKKKIVPEEVYKQISDRITTIPPKK
jgi:DNA uptake protein ComE-like DNA-binding protein